MYTRTDLCRYPPRDWDALAACTFTFAQGVALRGVSVSWRAYEPHENVRGPYAAPAQERPSQDEMLAPDFMVYKEGIWERRAQGTGVLLDMGERPNNSRHGY